MRIVLALLMIMLGGRAMAQTQPIRNQFTTNNALNLVQHGWSVVWNDIAKKWSNVNITGLVTNITGTGNVLVTSNGFGDYNVLGLATNGVTNIVVLTNGVVLGNPSAFNFSSGITGFLSGVTANLGVNIPGGVILSNTTWVAKNGNDTTALISRPDLPFLTISNAVQASLAGFTVVVEPGTYNESVLLKDRVNLHLMEGADLALSGNTALRTIFDNNQTITNIIDGFGTIRRIGATGNAAAVPIELLGDGKFSIHVNFVQTDSTIAQGAIYVDGNSTIDFTGDIYSGGAGILLASLSGQKGTFKGRIYATNDVGFFNTSNGTNYFSGFCQSLASSAAWQAGSGLLTIENAYLKSRDSYGINIADGDVEIHSSRLESAATVNGTGNAIVKYSGNNLILDDVQLISGPNNVYSIDNQDDTGHGDVYIRNTIWANTPIRPDMNVVSNGFSILPRWMAIHTNKYTFPALQGAAGTALTNNGSGILGWGPVVAGTGSGGGESVWTNDNGHLRPIVYPTFRLYPTNDDFNSPIMIMGGAGASNWFTTGYGGNLRDYSLFSANIVAEGDLDIRKIGVATAQDTGGSRYGYAALETKTNQSLVFTETLITGEGVHRFYAGYVDGQGSGIVLMTNTQNAFIVDQTGGISLMKGVPQNWPDAQGGAATVLTNDGAGNLGWGTGGGGGSGTVAGSGTEFFIPMWRIGGTSLTNSGFYQLGTNRVALGATNNSFIFNDPAVQNVGIGDMVMMAPAASSFNTVVGSQSFTNPSGTANGNTFVGASVAPAIVDGDNNIGIGWFSLNAITTGADNIGVGVSTLQSLVSGIDNTAVGRGSMDSVTGSENTSLGRAAGSGMVGSGIRNTFIGAYSDTFSLRTNSTALGYLSIITSNNQMVFGSGVSNYQFRGVNYIFPGAQGAAGTVLTNNGAGGLGWGTAAGSGTNISGLVVTNLEVIDRLTLGGIPFNTNQFTTNISFTPVIGSLWLDGVNGGFMTNGQRRASFEWIPTNQSLRIGSLGNIGQVAHNYLNTSNFWDPPNVGQYSFVFGSNNLANANYSSILGGAGNLIYTNSSNCVISIGMGNVIGTNAPNSVIAGGLSHTIHINAYNSVIGGGSANTIQGGANSSTIAGGASGIIQAVQGTVGGGFDNVIGNTAATAATIAGGRNSRANSADSFVGGGHLNVINTLGAGATIVGGDGNSIGDSAGTGSTYSFIGGGSANNIDGQGNTTGYAVIAGGQQNHIEAGTSWAFIGGGFKNDLAPANSFAPFIVGGISNSVNAAYAGAVGSFLTNATASTIDIGHGAAGGNNRKARFDVNGLKVLTYGGGAAAVGGTYLVTNTPIASAGATATNLQQVTLGVNVLTNNQERFTFRASGRFAATSDTKQLEVVYGSEVIYDSSAQVANTGAWTIEGEIIRTGATAQSCNVNFSGNTNTLFVAAQAVDTVQTNGVATVLKIRGTTAGDGGITNRTLVVNWWPAP